MRRMELILAGLLIATITSCRSNEDSADSASMAQPVRSIECLVKDGMQDVFMAAVEAFSKVEALEMDAAISNPARGSVVIQLVKEDYEIVAVNPFEFGKFMVHFYYHREGTNASRAEIDRLARDFARSVSTSSSCRTK